MATDARPEQPQSSARRVGGRILSFPDLSVATQTDFGKGSTAIFVHGFTANADYMLQLMEQFNGSGFNTLAYEYPSDRGIHQAAKVLAALLRGYDQDGAISKERVVLVCHSMGGLVGRALITLEGGAKYVRKILTLGTPHLGILKNDLIVNKVLAWGEFVGGLNANAFKHRSTSALELVDADSTPTLLSRLRQNPPSGGSVDFYSISGGLSYLEFGSSAIKNLSWNIYLQQILGKPNDGLVDESSSNLAGAPFQKCAPGCLHQNSYVEYEYVNHSNLVNNQLVALETLAYARAEG